MRSDSAAALQEWMDNWADPVEFEVVAVRTSDEAARDQIRDAAR